MVITAVLFFSTSCPQRKQDALTYTVQEENIETGELEESLVGGVEVDSEKEYPVEYNAGIQFSFYPGLRLRLNNIFTPITFIIVDVGYLGAGFSDYVRTTDSFFGNSCGYLNLDVMFGTQQS